jgi:HAD superfamily hydrolase (TIGR01509 family)
VPAARHLPELVIFDCDGVLVDSETISNQVLARTLTAAGVPTTTEESFATYQGLMLDDIVSTAQRISGRTLPDGFIARFQRDRQAEFEARLQPVPGARTAIEAVKSAGIKACVASQGQLVKTELTLGLTGLRPLFDDEALFSAYDVARGKPHPDLFLHAADRMGATPATSVVVEDSASGVRAAVAAGMSVFGYAPHGDGAPLHELGAGILTTMAQLPLRLGI